MIKSAEKRNGFFSWSRVGREHPPVALAYSPSFRDAQALRRGPIRVQGGLTYSALGRRNAPTLRHYSTNAPRKSEMNSQKLIDKNLEAVLVEMSAQTDVAKTYSPHTLDFASEMDQIGEYLAAGEYSIACEIVVASLEGHAFVLSGVGAIKLLEVGLLMGFNSSKPADSKFSGAANLGTSVQSA